MPLNLLLPWWAKYVAAIALCAVIFGYGYIRGLKHEETLYDAFVAQTEANAKVAEVHNKQVAARQQEITKNVQSDWTKNAQALTDYYKSHPRTQWLSNSPSGCVMPVIPEASGKSGADSAGKGGIAEVAATGNGEGIPIDMDLAGKGLIKLFGKDRWVNEQSVE